MDIYTHTHIYIDAVCHSDTLVFDWVLFLLERVGYTVATTYVPYVLCRITITL